METTDDQLEHRYDAYLAQCPCRPLLDVIANKWAALIVGALLAREHRFGELRRQIEGISQKVLTANLRALERNGFVARRVYPTSPPSVGYSLTGLGRSLAPPLIAVREWTEVHMDDVQAARARYDTGTPLDATRSGPAGVDRAAEPAAAR